MGKRYKCPYCEKRDERKKLIDHIDKRHQEMLPDGYDGARVMYDKINHTDGHGICRVCKKDTPWNPKAQRYDVLCGNPKCKEAMREEYKKNMLRVRGTYNILNDPEQQKKMLANRSISGKYKFKDGGVVTYTASYEKKYLEFIDEFMEIPSKDIMMPGPTLEYTYKGEKHFYITDCLYIPYNAIIEIKDGGDNPNNKSTPGMIASREKTIQKEKLITDRGEYNYIRLTNNDFTQLIEFFMEIKEKILNDDPSMTIRIHESCVEESFAINEKDLYINFDKFESGKSNILLITGLSGSGKSTLAANLAKKYKCENFELDCLDFYLGGYLSKEKAKKYEPALYDFIEKKNLKQDKNLSSNELYKEYIKYIISWCKKRKDTKYIIEGLQIYEVYEDGDSFITSNPIIIKGTSALISSIRAAKRNEGPFLKEFKDLIKWAIKDSKSMKKLKNSLKEDYIEESNKDDKLLEDIKEFNKELATYEYIIVNDDDSVIQQIKQNSFDNYKTLSPERFKKFKGGICWDYVAYEYKYFKSKFSKVKIKTFYFAIVKNGIVDNTHTFLLFYLNDKVYWFEASWKSHVGIIEYDSEDEALSDIINTLRSIDKKNDWFIVEYNAGNNKFINISDEKYINEMNKLPEYRFKETKDINKKKIQSIKINNGKIVKEDYIEESSKSNYSYVKLETDKDIEDFRKSFKAAFKQEPDYTDAEARKGMKAIKYNDKVIGYIGFSHYTIKGKKYLGIGNFMIKVEYQNSGYGAEVVKDIVEKNKSKYDEIYCYVEKENTGAIRFYKRIAKVGTTLTKYGYYVTFYKKK